MDAIQQQIHDLRLRLRLQTLVSFGALVVLAMAAGGADVVAKTLVEADAWKVSTKRLNGTVADRLVVTTDVDKARIKILEGNLELAKQSGEPFAASTAEGTLWYDDAANALKFSNGSAWVGPGGAPPAGASPSGVFGRLEITGTTSTTLNFKQYMGDFVDVNGQYVQIGAGKSLVSTTTTLLSTNAGALNGAMAANTTYCIYISNAAASPAPSEIRASAISPVLYNGVKYLNTTGNGAHWRFLGWARTNASNVFENNDGKRFVINYYNRRALRLSVVTNNTSYVSYSVNSWTSWLNATTNRVEFISNGEDPVYLYFGCCTGNTAARWTAAGIGLNTTTANHGTINASSFSNYYGYASSVYNAVPPEGDHYLQLLMNAAAGGTTYWYGKDGTTHLQPGAAGHVMG